MEPDDAFLTLYFALLRFLDVLSEAATASLSWSSESEEPGAFGSCAWIPASDSARF